MHVHPRRRAFVLAISALCFAALLALWGSSGSAIAAASSSSSSLAGTWSGKYSGAYSGTFRLHWTQSGSTLSGSIALSHPKGTYHISGSVHRGAITFGAVGAGATYTGSVSGKSMSGSYKTAKGVGKWSAHKVS
jgi:hypothetical protein